MLWTRDATLDGTCWKRLRIRIQEQQDLELWLCVKSVIVKRSS
ncbi:hypothetical protein [Butyrivibrio sp. DSM 10294]|nr:hypothetical protein [Butyrivibrio sp. DSM 10294]